MGQTLTHGIYLPDEGERNCYDGLAANWQLLDNSVGTVAEHTTALAGKAPAVHTHTKSDVTDLLNSNFIPSANNTYDLGSSSYQWNNVYSKGYYYNGVAWGLDKYNQWTGVNDFNNLIGLNNAELWFKQPNIEDITVNPVSDTSKSILQIWNKGTTQYCGGIIDGLMTDGTHKFTISCLGFPLNNYAGYYPHSFSFEAKRDGTASFSPNYTNASLGTSTNKWKSLNGTNPGALSLPNTPGGTGIVNVNYYDLSGNITVRDGSAANGFTAPCDGWIAIGTFASWLQISNDTLILATTANPGADGFAQAFLPVRKGNAISIVVNQTNTQFQSFKLLPCEGNV